MNDTQDAGRASAVRGRIPASAVIAIFIAALGLQQLLLWSFLGLSPWLIGGGGIALAIFCFAMQRLDGWPPDFTVDWRLIGVCFAIALLLFTLGGQGGFFYANADWQVRNAVLYDLVTQPWPFAYPANGEVDVLRAPLGLYLLPALLGKACGLKCAQIVMLVQSATLLTCILSLGSGLFDSTRKRLIALAVFLAFSGMDVLGQMLVGRPLSWHLEWWSVAQFSSHVTQAFWVPMHALAGWAGALLYLLWRIRRIPLAAFLSPLPLLALLSPLALIGVVPFAADAGISALRSKSIRLPDVLMPLAAVILSLPALLYLSSGSGAVGARFVPLPIGDWGIFETLEVIPYLAAALLARQSSRFGPHLPLLAGAILFVVPWGKIGVDPDFSMRASVPALAILAVLVADLFVTDRDGRELRLGRAIAIPALLIGSVTPGIEIWHAISRPPPALPSCSLFGVVPKGAPTYVTQLQSLPRLIAPAAPALVRSSDPASCRELKWNEVEWRFSKA